MPTKEKKERRSYAKRDPKEFNWFRKWFLFAVTKFGYMIRYKLVYRLEVLGKENIPKTNSYIVAANHLSTSDPPLICGIMPHPVGYMAKQELFEIRFLRWWLDWLGAFAVNREKLGPSTIKTVKALKERGWVLGLFPQGTRCEPGIIDDVTKGFVNLAKLTKCDILPVGIVGTQETKHLPFTGKITVKIGKVISYDGDVDEMIKKWIKSIEELTGFRYIGKEYEEEERRT